MKLCPRCNNEILPYLKTGELKEIREKEIGALDFINSSVELVSYQLYFCIHCRVVFSIEHERFEFLDLKQEEETNKKLQKQREEIANGSRKEK